MNYAAITDESIASDDYWLMVEDAANRLADERRFAVPGCPWGCDGSGRLISG